MDIGVFTFSINFFNFQLFHEWIPFSALNRQQRHQGPAGPFVQDFEVQMSTRGRASYRDESPHNSTMFEVS
jgi:hypothetical protein